MIHFIIHFQVVQFNWQKLLSRLFVSLEHWTSLLPTSIQPHLSYQKCLSSLLLFHFTCRKLMFHLSFIFWSAVSNHKLIASVLLLLLLSLLLLLFIFFLGGRGWFVSWLLWFEHRFDSVMFQGSVLWLLCTLCYMFSVNLRWFSVHWDILLAKHKGFLNLWTKNCACNHWSLRALLTWQ